MSEATAPIDREIAALGPWFHNLHLPDGRQTVPDHPLGDFPQVKWDAISGAIPHDLEGWSVLDIGCNAAFYSFELARRGARVIGVDREPLYLRQAEWARDRMAPGLSVEFRQCQIYELARDVVRDEAPFDLVWFMGVAYHLRHPLLALDLARVLTRRLMVFQMLSIPGKPASRATPVDLPLLGRERLAARDWPRMAFIEHALAGDDTNWWAADLACMEAMLRSSGFRIIARPETETFVCEPTEVSHEVRAELLAVFGETAVLR